MAMLSGTGARRDATIGWLYRHILKPVYFRLDPEFVHERMSHVGMTLGKFSVTRALTRRMFGFQHPSLQTTVAGLEFPNPVGLSAGFDKEGRLIDILPSVGFGFMEIGSITGSYSAGNKKPRLWRLPKSRGLVVHYGLNSSGSMAVASRLYGQQTAVPLFVSIAKANHPDFDSEISGIADYVRAATNLRGIGAARVINISCPNTTGGEPFIQPERLDHLLGALGEAIQQQPTFIKLPADCSDAEIDGIVATAQRHGITGFICTNLTKRRDNGQIHDAVVPPKGGLSGKIVEAQSNHVLRHVYKITDGQMPLIGVGGIFSAEDAYKKIRSGASLVALITGMIYQGPQLIGEINRGLVELLQRDGFENISEAVGIDVYK